MTETVDLAEIRRRAAGATPDAPDLTHDGLALELGELWANEARYVAAWGRWYFWDRGVWREDQRLEHMTRARAYLREVADASGKEGKPLRRAETVAKVISLARSNETQAAGVEQWDANPWLLGSPGGTVDLGTGRVRDARPEDYITMTTAVAPAPHGTLAPLWSEHLSRIFDDDQELIAYLQRFFGYALTGSIREHAFAFGHGGGGNGKGVTLKTVKDILGDYAVTIPTEMLMVSHSDRHPTELARLRGVRLAIGSETEEGKRWAEAKVKALTGGDPIAARFMRQDYFEFEPTFKLVVIGNHRPSLRGVDEAMRRRLHFIPFEVTIPEEERDLDLPEKLEEEWPAILRWMIDGCEAWQRDGLNPPDSVREATRDYLEAEDALTLWMEDCCTADAAAFEPIAGLYWSWKRWADEAGEYAGSKKRFSAALEDRGLTPHRTSAARGFRGLRLDEVRGGERWEP